MLLKSIKNKLNKIFIKLNTDWYDSVNHEFCQSFTRSGLWMRTISFWTISNRCENTYLKKV